MSDNIYNFRQTQDKWREKFSQYKVDNNNVKNKKYVLEMLPYPSGKLHMGHVRNYVIGDIMARFYDLQGFDVIHPMGWDAFGLPAENAAIKSGEAPEKWTLSNIADMKKELMDFGFMYDWPREVSTCSPEYYFQEQKIFLDMYKHGLVQRKKSYVNWDPEEMTVLANEQVIGGRGWRSGALVEKKLLEQWTLKITAYTEELLDGLKDLEDGWPEKVLKMQENWIGKSDGAIVNFELVEKEKAGCQTIEVFTTRPDTLFGASFLAISADHEISTLLAKNDTEIKAFIAECKKNAVSTEAIETMEKLGKPTGLYVINPVNGEKLPVYIANFVLMDYGTGAVFACPAHDERDFDFAKKYDLPIRRIIESAEDLPYTGDGVHINSGFLDGLNVPDAKKKMIEFLEKQGSGQRKTTYKLRDWLVSRQRYWGCPIPFIHCPKCGLVPVPENDLPVLLPKDAQFDGKGNPLEKHPSWKQVKCPACGQEAIRDTDTLDTFFESSWYFLRYLDPHCPTPINKEVSDKLMPVDLYIGGIEHAVLHLLYARFFTIALRDMGYLSFDHPFKKLLTQGMVCHKSYKDHKGEWLYLDEVKKDEHGNLIDFEGNPVTEGPSEKMSKSKKNLVSPRKIMDTYGIDAVRLFIVSDTPPEKDFDWNTDALEGSWRFLNKVWKTFNKIEPMIREDKAGDDRLIKVTHKYLKKITQNLESISLNKAVAFARELFNEIEKTQATASGDALAFAFKTFVKAMEPITPFLCRELEELLQDKDRTWPQFDANLATEEEVTIAIQVNGRLKTTLQTEQDTDEKTLEKKALELLQLEELPKKIIVVKNRIVNVVL